MRHIPAFILGNTQRILEPAAILIVVGAALSLPKPNHTRWFCATHSLGHTRRPQHVGPYITPRIPVLTQPKNDYTTPDAVVVFPSAIVLVVGMPQEGLISARESTA